MDLDIIITKTEIFTMKGSFLITNYMVKANNIHQQENWIMRETFKMEADKVEVKNILIMAI